MARWGLLVHEVVGNNQATSVKLLEEMDGTRQEAEQRMLEHIRNYNPRHPINPKRQRVYRTADGWLLIGDGAFNHSYPYRFEVAELVWDSRAK